MRHTSYSALSLYLQCPFRYAIERVENRKAPDSRPFRVGSAVHAGIAAYLRHLVEEGLQTDVTWGETALAEADAAMAREGRALQEDEREEVGEILAGFLSSHLFSPSQIAEIEKRDKIPLDGLQLWAVVDLLEVADGKPVITDWKSSWRVPSKAEAERDFQLRVYAWAVKQLYGFEEVTCRLDYVRHGVVREVEYGPEDISKTEKRILDTVEKIESEDEWRPTPGSHCAHCPWASECPTGEESEDPAELAGRILILEAQLREAQAKLKTWCNENGPVEVGGEVFGYLPPKDGGWTVTDKAAFAEILGSHGLDPWDYFSVSSQKLKSLRTAKKWAHVMADLEPLLTQDITVKFCHRKAEE